MSYKAELKKFDETNLPLYRIVVASEVDYFLGEIVTDNQFEVICEFVYGWIMATEAKAEEVVKAIKNIVANGDFKYEDFDHFTIDERRKLTDLINDTF